MKYIILFLLIPFFGFSQGGTWPVKYGDSDPSGAPSAAGTRLYFNTATNTLFTWEPAPSSTWRKQPKAFDQISGCAAPTYTPTARQSTFAVNSCTPKPELYQWTGSAWALLNPETLYTAGTGISIASGVISNTGDLSTTNELNTSLSVTGGNLRLTDSGGNLDVPVSSIAPVQSVSAGAGINITGTTTRTISAVDVSATNELQTLSIAGQDLTLSGGGGTVAIPEGSSLGAGFTAGGGAGTIPDGTVATLDGTFEVVYPNGYSLKNGFVSGESIGDGVGFVNDEFNYAVVDNNRGNKAFNAHFDTEGAFGDFLVSAANVIFQNIEGDDISTFQLSTGSVQFASGNISGSKAFSLTADLGLTFDADYSATIVTNPTSITDVASVNLLKQTPVSYTNAAAPNNCIFYSTTLSKLAYKDPGGTVNPLY